jgi:hypothetical protein
VKLTVVSEPGKEAVVAIIEPKEFFGDGCMNGYKLAAKPSEQQVPSLAWRPVDGESIQIGSF